RVIFRYYVNASRAHLSSANILSISASSLGGISSSVKPLQPIHRLSPPECTDFIPVASPPTLGDAVMPPCSICNCTGNLLDMMIVLDINYGFLDTLRFYFPKFR